MDSKSHVLNNTNKYTSFSYMSYILPVVIVVVRPQCERDMS